MKKFLRELFSDDNTLNEKSIVGFLAFFAMMLVLVADIVTGIISRDMPVHEFVFDGFLVIVLGAFGIASVDKYLSNRNKSKPDNEE
jgi:hypothetical protein